MTLSSAPAPDRMAPESRPDGSRHGSQTHDEFISLVQRYSGMVLGVCRRILANADAEDAAQAVFVLFWQKAMHLRNESQIAAWLHRTAQFVSLNARNSRTKRSVHEQQAAAETPTMSPAAVESAQWNEISGILDEEVDRLPEHLRVVFVLFHLQNRSLAEVADLTGASVPTVGTRLQRSRDRLAANLKRRGIVVGASTLAAMLSQLKMVEAVPPDFVTSTLATVSSVSTVGINGCTPTVAALVKGGAVGGFSKSFWIFSSLAAFAIGFPLVVIWMLPALQTRFSPDYARLQGEWREVAQEQNGDVMAQATSVEYVGTLEFHGRQFKRFQTLADGRVLGGGSGSFVLDSAQHPASINFNQLRGTTYGVYHLDGDSLTVCISTSGGPRPDQLVTASRDNRLLSRYTRLKESSR